MLRERSWELQKLVLQTEGAASLVGLQGFMGLANGIQEVPTRIICLNQVCILYIIVLVSLYYHSLKAEWWPGIMT
jgi:hypothetical protein